MIKKILAILIILLAVLCPVSVALDYNLTYDNNGNLLQNANQRYEYDGFNQLSKVYNSNGVLLEEYTYNSEGNRIKKVEHLPNNQLRTTYYVSQNLVRVVNSSGTFDTYYYYDNLGTLLSRKDPDGKKYYYHPDHLGSNTLITDEQGNVVAETSYLPFGEVWEGGNDRFLYTGKERDGSGLMYYGARYYDPVLKKFTQPDTIIPNLYNPQSLNRYSYVLNNPYKYKDNDGHNPVLGALIGAVIGAAYEMIKQELHGASMFDGSMDWGEVLESAVIGAGAGLAGGATWAVGEAAGMTAGIIEGSSWGAASAMIAGRGRQITSNLLNGNTISDNMLDTPAMARDAIIGGITGGIAGAFSPSVVGSSYNEIKPTQDSVNPFIVEGKMLQTSLAKFGLTEKPMVRVSSFEEIGSYTTDGHHAFVSYTKMGYPVNKMNINRAQFSTEDTNLFPNVGKYNDWSNMKYKLRGPR